MQLHLILPGLLWPQQILRDTLYDLELPGLAWLVGRARSRWEAPQSLETCLCQTLGIDAEPAPLAALRRLGEAPPDAAWQDAIWMCADPASLRIERNRVALVTEGLDITDAEMQQIAAALTPLFSDLGAFQAGRPGHGYLQLHAQPDFDTPPPSAMRDASDLLPQGADATQWRRLGNEAQIILHNLPLNAAREQQGKPALNSLCFWGAGRLPTPSSRAHSRSHGFTQLIGRQSLLPGLAQWGQLPAPAPGASLQELLASKTAAPLLLLDDLIIPTQQRHAMSWRMALQRIDQAWLQPLPAALASGRIHSLHLTALGEQARLDLTLQRSDRLKFWRRPRAFHEFALANSPNRQPAP